MVQTQFLFPVLQIQPLETEGFLCMRRVLGTTFSKA